MMQLQSQSKLKPRQLGLSSPPGYPESATFTKSARKRAKCWGRATVSDTVAWWSNRFLHRCQKRILVVSRNEAVCAARARMPIQRTSQQAWCAQLAPTFKSNFQNPRVPPTGGSHLPHAHPGSFEMRRTVPVPTCGAGGGRQSALISPEVAEPVG
jgi:hypothetical protein